MKIEIWSDVVCPFCYIGKKRIESVIKKYDGYEKFEIIWKSFQLNPNQQTQPELNSLKHLSEAKGWSMDQTKQIINNVCEIGSICEIKFEFEKSKVANSLNAHKLLHLAKKKNVQNEMKERLFHAYFTDGINIDDIEKLIEISNSFGISREDCMLALNNSEILKEIHSDFSEAQEIGIRGVPYFVFDRKYAVSGAQEETIFENVIQEILKERV